MRPKTCSYLTDNNHENKKAKCKKECVKKKQLKNENYGHYLEDTHFENKINQLEGDKIDVNSPSELLKGFIKTIN